MKVLRLEQKKWCYLNLRYYKDDVFLYLSTLERTKTRTETFREGGDQNFSIEDPSVKLLKRETLVYLRNLDFI